ncbi:hypothetical protein MPTK1_8g01870 [Marchantia polymorpha subsp. ruderalis]|uniref:Uncharacterized protein n=1 Tax=Marchantia polymorpha TaxID=3197 RepID=A0A2R6WR30_MARPO|nr:hypothetical protein MARPO_0064s0011 [Marchantia polymorpha]BBN18353.1 hypothetical protein Mp_8g01870 [Marchantia polymorpha subsp. ruderalis]|eukprot:PTQ36318.1 hypothetical protein MARPO_0064s0011 [Marchantia polymorpha]
MKALCITTSEQKSSGKLFWILPLTSSETPSSSSFDFDHHLSNLPASPEGHSNPVTQETDSYRPRNWKSPRKKDGSWKSDPQSRLQ